MNLLNKPDVATASLVANEQGATLVLSQVPSQATAVRLTRLGPWDWAGHPISGTTAANFDIPVSALNNDTYPLSGSQFVPPNGDSYTWFVQALAGNDQSDVLGIWDYPATNAPPFYDGRRQLKDNLVFLLRDANANNPFQVGLYDTNGQPAGVFTTPTAYAYAGYYQSGTGAYGSDSVDVFRPFEDNYFYRNFVFSTTNIDGNGNLTTGVGQVRNSPFFAGLLFFPPPTYQFQPSAAGTNVSSLLRPNEAEWLCIDPEIWSGDIFNLPNGLSISFAYDPVFQLDGQPVITFNGGVSNYWGLPFVSAKIYYYDDYLNLQIANLNAGDSVATWNPNAFYIEAAQPQFQTVKYDFWNPNAVWKETLVLPALPGDPNFSPTNQSAFIIAAIGAHTQVAGYAKLAVTNGYPGVYGYLGQYFDKAYTENANGVATTNSAGFLTPYGDFFPTQVGRAALVTMPDIDPPYQRGTNTVYVVGLALDKNHDGNIDLSLTGSDYTSPSSPCVFWRNNNFDRWNNDWLSSAEEQDDVLPGGSDAQNYDPNDPDCNYKVNGYRAIPDSRDLEDFARLWICGVTSNLLTALPPNSTVTLSWAGRWDGYEYVYSNYPTIDLFQAADSDGGIGYLTNETVATAQLDPYQASYVGRLVPGGSIQLNANYFGSTWRGDHFIWCGVSNGTGGLVLTIADGNSNVLGQSTVYIQIKDIKDMYERWTVGDDPGKVPMNVATNAYNDLPTGEMPFHYATPQDTNTTYILHVHGYNMATWEKDRFAETEFKRLYWQGYQGRFGEFRWPTTHQGILNLFSAFNLSESNAWASAPALLNLLNRLNAEYPGNVYLTAHSHGNVTAGEALRLAGNSQVVNTYIAMQGAIASHAYDPTTPYQYTFPYPDYYARYYPNGGTNYFNGVKGAGTFVNFFNTNDFALTGPWPVNQAGKPASGYSWLISGGQTNFYSGSSPYYTLLLLPADRYTIFSYCDPATCYALGAQAYVGGAFASGTNYNQVELDIAPFNFGKLHIYHSGEFRADYAQRWQFWDYVLFRMGLKKSL